MRAIKLLVLALPWLSSVGCGADVTVASDTHSSQAADASHVDGGEHSPGDARTPDVDPAQEVAEDVAPDVPVDPNEPPEAWSKCVACHGDDGRGTAIGYEIWHIPRGYGEWIVRNGRDLSIEFAPTIMPSFDEVELPAEDLDAIFAWLESRPIAETNAELYWDYCASCHGAEAKGGAVFHDLLHEADKPDVILQYVRNGVGGSDYGDRLKYMPAWTEDAITDAQVQGIIEHLQSLK